MVSNQEGDATAPECDGRKKIAFLSFGRWRDIPGSRTRTASDAYLQTIELAEAAEHIGLDGAFLRVHHFANLLGSPFPLLAAIGARTQRIEIGTGVIDLRYESPLHMAEAAAVVDLISGGRLQVGIGRSWPGTPQVAVTRTVLPITSGRDRLAFSTSHNADRVIVRNSAPWRFGRDYIGAPDTIAAELKLMKLFARPTW